MQFVRHSFYFRASRFSVLLIGALLLNSLAPAGYMIAPSATGVPAVMLCPQTHPLARQTMSSRDLKAGHVHHQSHKKAGNEMAMSHGGETHEGYPSTHKVTGLECAFAGMAQLATGAVEPALLIDAIAFAQLLEMGPVRRLVLPQLDRLRPPLRAPPTHA